MIFLVESLKAVFQNFTQRSELLLGRLNEILSKVKKALNRPIVINFASRLTIVEAAEVHSTRERQALHS